jgi:hypothetical protein
VAKQATHVEASRVWKRKKAKNAKKRTKKEMEIAHWVQMGEDHDVMQEELQSKPSIDSDGEEESKEVESEYEDDTVFVIEPCYARAMGTMKGPGVSSSAPKAKSAPPMGTQSRRRR